MAFRALLAALALIPSVAAAGDFFTLKGHGGPIKGIDVSPDGGRILTASFDFSVGLWRGGTPVWLEAHRAAVNAVRFIDRDRAVSAGDDFQLYLWNLSTGKARRLGRHQNKVNALELSPDRRTVAAASWDGTIGLWPLDGGKPSFLKGHRSNVSDIAYAADGKTLYSASADGTIRTWDPEKGSRKRFFLRHGFGVNTLVLNDTANWLAYGSLDGTVRAVDAETGIRIADFTSDRSPILAMAADPDFATLAVGDGEGFIKVIDTRTWSVLRNFRATLRGPVWALRFSPDGKNIHAGGLDDAMYSWPVDSLGKHERMTREERTFLRKPSTMGNGERQFQRKCSICHALGPDGRRRAGPTLFGVFGRRAGGLAGYKYSRTLRNSDIVWSDRTIDALFDQGPDDYIPGSKMPMQRIVKPADRDDLIAFLKRATTEREKTE